MRRLICCWYALLFGIQVKTQEQHIADLEKMLEGLYQAAHELDAEIEVATDRLLKAQVMRDEAKRQYERVDTRSPFIDRAFPDPAPRSY